MGTVDLALGQYDASIVEYHLATDAGYRTYHIHMYLAAAYALVGKTEEAQAALAEARRLNPNLTIKWRMAHGPDTPHLYEGLRRAGLPEE